MVSDYKKSDIDAIVNMGSKINPNFSKLFNISKLPEKERIYVYKEDENVLGFIHILINIDCIEILNIVVDEKNQRKGIGTIMLDYLLSSTDFDISRILLEVRESNTAAINLYHKFNFYIIATRKNYYDNKENALIMERSDS